MRILSIVQWHHFAYMIISLALLGYGASGTVIALGRRVLERHFALAFVASAWMFGVFMVVCLIVGQRVPFNALEVVWDPHQLLHLGVLYLVFFVPFFFAAGCIGLAFTCLRSHANRIYLFDLAGAGLGALAIIGTLYLLPPGLAVMPLAGLAFLGSALATMLLRPRLRVRAALVLVATAVAFLVSLPRDWLELQLSPFKGLSQTMEIVGTRILGTRSSPLGLLTVVESPRIPFRHAPGLSLGTTQLPPEQLAVFSDGDSMSPITRLAGDPEALGYLADLTTSLPYRLLRQPRVLILGAGAGADVLAALHHEARSVDAVELNPDMVELVQGPYAEFAGDLYRRDRVIVHIDEARGFVARSEERYDLIQLALLDSFAASGAGVQALSESYLYTVEAFQEFLKHTTPVGMLAITRWLKLPPRDSLKLVATAIEALRREGVADPGDNLVMIRSWNTSTLLVKTRAFGSGEIAAVRDFADARSFDLVYYPGMPAAEANRFNLLPEPYLHAGTVALLGEEAGDYIRRYKFDISPAIDDRPYFFHFFRWSSLPEMMALRKRGGAGLLELGYLILIATLAQAALAGSVLIVLPLAAVRRTWSRRTGVRMGTYFFLLGLAFMFVEMAFIQRFILFLSHPIYSVAVVLAGFLIFAGLGSGASRALDRRAARLGQQAVSVAVAAIAIIALLYALALPRVFGQLIGLPDAAKIAITLGLIGPLAFFMGMPFPLGLGRLADSAADFIPWAWGINGFASVLSASLATVLAIEFGFTAVLVTALVLYAAAAGLITRVGPR